MPTPAASRPGGIRFGNPVNKSEVIIFERGTGVAAGHPRRPESSLEHEARADRANAAPEQPGPRRPVMSNRTRLLVLAAEDFTGLWEAPLELAHEASAEDAAGQELAALVDEGLIELFVGTDPAQETPRALDRAAIPDALRPGPQWSVPEPGSRGPCVYFAASDTGVALVQRLNWGENN